MSASNSNSNTVTVAALSSLMTALNDHLVKTKQVPNKSALPPVMKPLKVKGADTIHKDLLTFMSFGGIELLKCVEDPAHEQAKFPAVVLRDWKAQAAAAGDEWTVALLIHKWAAQASKAPEAERDVYSGAVRIGAAGKSWHAVVRLGASTCAVRCGSKLDPRETAEDMFADDVLCKTCCKAVTGDPEGSVEEFAGIVGLEYKDEYRPRPQAAALAGFVPRPKVSKSSAKRVGDDGLSAVASSHVSGSRVSGSRVSGEGLAGAGAGAGSGSVGRPPVRLAPGEVTSGPVARPAPRRASAASPVHLVSAPVSAFHASPSPRLSAGGTPRTGSPAGSMTSGHGPAHHTIAIEDGSGMDDEEVDDDVAEEAEEAGHGAGVVMLVSQIGSGKAHCEGGCRNFNAAVAQLVAVSEVHDKCANCIRSVSAFA